MRQCGIGRMIGLMMLFVVANFAGPVRADDIRWQEDPSRAWKAATESGRPMFIFATMEGCVHCRRMEHSTFSDLTVSSHVNSRFVPIFVPLDRHEELIESWRITTFPTTLLVAPNGAVLARIKGFAGTDELLRQTQAALRSHAAVVETAKAKDGPSQR